MVEHGTTVLLLGLARRKYTDLRANKRLRVWWDRLIAANPTGFAHWQWVRHYQLTG